MLLLSRPNQETDARVRVIFKAFPLWAGAADFSPSSQVALRATLYPRPQSQTAGNSSDTPAVVLSGPITKYSACCNVIGGLASHES